MAERNIVSIQVGIVGHGSPESCEMACDGAGLSSDAIRRFRARAQQNNHTIEYAVDAETGEAIAIAFDGRRIQEE